MEVFDITNPLFIIINEQILHSSVLNLAYLRLVAVKKDAVSGTTFSTLLC